MFQLSGVVDKDYISELDELFGLSTDYHDVIVDMRDVQTVDRASVQFLRRCEANGLRLENCPPYVREWISSEAVDQSEPKE